MHRSKPTSSLLSTMRTVDCLVAKLYAYTGCLRDMAALKEALLISGIRNICPALNMLAQCRYSYELGEPVLHQLVAVDNVEQLEALLPKLAFDNPNVKISKHVTLLHAAVYAGAVRCLKFLLRHPRLLCLGHTMPEDLDHNILTIAVSKLLPCHPSVRVEMIRAILERDRDGRLARHQVGSERRNALMLALMAKHLPPSMISEIVDLLLAAPNAAATLAQQEFTGRTALMLACRNEGNHEFSVAFDLLKKLLAADVSGEILRVQCNIGWTALMYVVENGGTWSSGAAVHVLTHILEARPDPALLTQKTLVGNSIIALLLQFNGLSEYDLLHAMRLILAADTTRTLAASQNNDGWTALMYACYNLVQRSGGCVFQVASLLVEHDGTGSLILARDGDGWNALMIACLTGYGLKSKQKRALIELLLSQDATGKTVSDCTTTGWNALMIVCRNKLLNLSDSDVCALIRRLVELDRAGTSLCTVNNFGWNALMVLCRNKAHYHSSVLERCIHELLKSPGASAAVQHRAPNGISALLLLCQRKCLPEQRILKMVQQLVARGALTTLDWIAQLHGTKEHLEAICTAQRKTRAQKLDCEIKLGQVIKITRLLTNNKPVEAVVAKELLAAPC